jgi:ABC-2 type transport system ATP-binding protein
MLEIKNVSKKYWKTRALEDVSFSVAPGEIVGLFGENGAGKTTLLKCIPGFLDYSGEILLDGEPVSRKNVRKISFATSEHSFFPELTAKAHEEFYKDHFPCFDQKRYDGLMKFFGLPENKKLKSFSTGQQNQYEMILALSQGAELILMDEPFAGNDLFNREDFYKVLLGILRPDESVIISTHLIEEVSGFVSRAVLIRRGEIVGDKTISEMDAEGKDLVSFVKESYGYSEDRVAEALADITGEVKP